MVSLMRKCVRFAMCVAGLVIAAAVILATNSKRDTDAPNGKASPQSRTVNHATSAPCTNADAFANGCSWLDMDAKEFVKLPPREPLDTEGLGRLMQMQAEVVQAYSNNDASILRELRGTLPALVERIPPEQFQGAMLGFVELVLEDVQLADLHPQPMAFSDAKDLSRFLEARLTALLLVGDMLVKRKDFGPRLAACEGHTLGALRNLESQFARDGRPDLVEATLKCRGNLIDHVESASGYLRAYVMYDIAHNRLCGDATWPGIMLPNLKGTVAFMEDRGQYRPKWLDELIGIVEVQPAAKGRAR